MESVNSSIVIRKLRPIVLCAFLALLTMLEGSWLEAKEVEEYFIFQLNDKKGVRNSKDKILIPAEYEDLGWSIGEFHPLNETLGFKENGLWGLLSLKNKKIIPAKYLNLYPLNRQLMVASVIDPQVLEERYGVIDSKGNVVLDFQYGPLSLFNNVIVTSTKKGQAWRYGVLNLAYQEVLPFKYSQIKPVNNKYAIVKEGNMNGLIDASGSLIVPPQYHIIELNDREFRGKVYDTYEIRNDQNQMLATHQVKDLRKADKGVLIASGMDETLLLNTKGKVIKSLPSTRVFEVQSGKAITSVNGKYGVINLLGKTLIPNTNEKIWLSDGYLGIQDSSNKWRLMDSLLTTVSKRDYQQINVPSEGLFPVKRLDSWGFIDDHGIELIPPQYQEVGTFQDDVALAKYLGSWGLINKQGNWLIKPRFNKLEKITEEVYLFQSAGQYGLANTSQEIVYETTNNLVPSITGAIEQGNGNLYGLISLTGEQMLSTSYSKVSAFQEDPNYYQFEDELGQGIFDISKRTFARDSGIQEMRTLNEGFIGVKINDQYGFVDLNVKLRIANRYENVGVFSEEMTPVKIRGKWGFVNRLERLKVQPIYETVSPFIGGLSIISQNKKYGLIDKTGKVVLGLNYQGLERLPDGKFVFQQGQKVGLVDSNGKVMLYPDFTSLESFENGLLKTSKNGKNGLINDQGKVLIPPNYDEIVYDQFNDLYLLTKKYPWHVIGL